MPHLSWPRSCVSRRAPLRGTLPEIGQITVSALWNEGARTQRWLVGGGDDDGGEVETERERIGIPVCKFNRRDWTLDFWHRTVPGPYFGPTYPWTPATESQASRAEEKTDMSILP